MCPQPARAALPIPGHARAFETMFHPFVISDLPIRPSRPGWPIATVYSAGVLRDKGEALSSVFRGTSDIDFGCEAGRA
jgi:hypothetical protein